MVCSSADATTTLLNYKYTGNGTAERTQAALQATFMLRQKSYHRDGSSKWEEGYWSALHCNLSLWNASSRNAASTAPTS